MSRKGKEVTTEVTSVNGETFSEKGQRARTRKKIRSNGEAQERENEPPHGVRTVPSRKGGWETMTTVCDVTDQDLGREQNVAISAGQMELSFPKRDDLNTDTRGGLKTHNSGTWQNRRYAV